MNWLAKTVKAGRDPLPPIGPGRLVLVVGPSGAGKDTLIGKARKACVGEAGIVFPRRLITRPISSYEDHDAISEQAFARAVTEGSFAFWWSAHGLRYALPFSVECDIARGCTVVCNVSRTIIGTLQARYEQVVVVLVTAPPDVLAARIAARGRASDGPMKERLIRSAPIESDLRVDVVIDNTDDISSSANKLLAAIRAPAVAT